MNESIADTKTHQRFVGLGLAGLIVAMWAILHVYCIFFLHLTGARWLAAPFLVAMQAWLSMPGFRTDGSLMDIPGITPRPARQGTQTSTPTVLMDSRHGS